PELGRLNQRHQNLLGSGAVHLFPHDSFNITQHSQAHRQPAVQARGQLADHAGPQHQLMADNLGIGGSFFECGNQKTASAHDMVPLLSETMALRVKGKPDKVSYCKECTASSTDLGVRVGCIRLVCCLSPLS